MRKSAFVLGLSVLLPASVFALGGAGYRYDGTYDPAFTNKNKSVPAVVIYARRSNPYQKQTAAQKSAILSRGRARYRGTVDHSNYKQDLAFRSTETKKEISIEAQERLKWKWYFDQKKTENAGYNYY